MQHAEWLGDGWCDYDAGCYNTEACGFDGGDCCADTCVDTQYISCGIHGYDCVDPAGQSCGGSDYTLTMYDSFGDGTWASVAAAGNGGPSARPYLYPLVLPVCCLSCPRLERGEVHDRGNPDKH